MPFDSFNFDHTHKGLICKGDCPIALNPSRFFEPPKRYSNPRSDRIDKLFAQWMCCDFRWPYLLDESVRVLAQNSETISPLYQRLARNVDIAKLDRNLIILIYLATFRRQTKVLTLVLRTAGKILPKCTLSHLLLHSIELRYEEGVRLFLEHGASVVEGLRLENSTLPLVVCTNHYTRLALRPQYPPEPIEVEPIDNILELIISKKTFKHSTNGLNIWEETLCLHLINVSMISRRASEILIKVNREALPVLNHLMLCLLVKIFSWQQFAPPDQRLQRLERMIENGILPMLRVGVRLDEAAALFRQFAWKPIPWTPGHETASLHFWKRPDGFEKLFMETTKKACIWEIPPRYIGAFQNIGAEKEAILLTWRGKMEQFQRREGLKLRNLVRKRIVEWIPCEDDVRRLDLPQYFINFLLYSDLRVIK